MTGSEAIHLLLPRPKRISLGRGNVAVGRKDAVVVSSIASPRAEEAAAVLAGEMAKICGTRPAIVKRSDTKWPGGLFIRDAVPGDFRFLPRPGSRLCPTPDEAYLLRAAGNRIEIGGIGIRGLRHGIRTFLQLLGRVPKGMAVPAVDIEDWPALAMRGVMEDVSRGKVPTIGTLKELVETLASWKINMFQLYVEHVFRFKKHPRIGSQASRLEPEEIRRLDDHCRGLGVELIPNFASFGHMERIFELPEYRRKYSVGPPHRLIMPLEEKTYRLLDELYAEFLPCFSSKYFNVNCDETWDLGKGRSASIVKRYGAGEVYLRHILKLYEIVTKKYGRRMMMWGDIIVNYPALIKRLPKDIIVLPWEYFGRWSPAHLRPFVRAGLDFLVCPGTCAWHSTSPFVGISNLNIKSAASSSAACGGMGIMNTDWGDAGHQQPLGLSRYAFAYGAEAAWSGGTTPDADFDRAFSWDVFGDRTRTPAELYRTLGEANHALRIDRKFVGWFYTVNFSLMFYMRSLKGRLLDGLNARGVDRLKRIAAKAVKLVRSLASRGKGDALLLRELKYSAGLISHLAAKLEWVLDARSGAGGSKMARRARGLISSLALLKRDFLAVWNARNRPRNREITARLFDGTAGFYRRIGRRF